MSVQKLSVPAEDGFDEKVKCLRIRISLIDFADKNAEFPSPSFNNVTKILILSPTSKELWPDDKGRRINQWLVTWRRGTCNRMKRFKTAWGHYMTYTLALILRWHKKWFQHWSHTESSWSGTKQTDWTDWALLNPCLSDSIKIIDFYQIRRRTLDLVRLSYISSFFFVLG